MSKEATKKFVENYGFICNNCGKIIVDGDKHRDEEDLCDQCKIADLETKFAESEKFMKDNGFKNLEELDNYIQKIHSHYDEVKNKGTCGLCEKLDNELINQLKQQLAEKDEQIKELTECNQYLQIYRNQDKISFAVEKLEKVKELIEEKYAYVIDECDYGVVYEDEIDKIFNNQIEELKKEMK